MTRDLGILFACVSLVITTVLLLQTLEVDDSIKTAIGKKLDKIPKSILSLTSLVSVCPALYYLLNGMTQTGFNVLGIVFVLILTGVVMVDIYFSNVFSGWRL